MISSRPYWLDTVTEADFRLPGAHSIPALPARAAIAIIGGGIVGLACAAYLSRAGAAEVVLLERGTLLCEASAANGGGLWHTEQAPGPGVFHQLGRESQRLLREFLAETGAEVHHRELGVLEVARSAAEAEALRERTARKQAGGMAAEWLEPPALLQAEPHLAPEQVFGAAWYPEDGHVNPARLGAAFAREAQRAGARVVTGVEVHGLKLSLHGVRVQTAQGTLEAERVVLAAGAWTEALGRCLGLQLPIIPARGQLIATEAAPPVLNHALFGPLGLIPTATGEILCGGTLEFVGYNREAPEETRERIWNDVRALLPALNGLKLTHSWTRFRPHTPDELPLLGPVDAEGRCLVAAGHFRNGLLLAPVTGRIVADLVTTGGTEYPLSELDPHRFAPESAHA